MMTQHGIQHPMLHHSFVSMISLVSAQIRNLSPSGETHWQWRTQNHSKENPRASNCSRSTLLMMLYSNKWFNSLLLMIYFHPLAAARRKAAEEFTLYISECEVVKWGGQYWILHNWGSFNQNSFKFSIEQKVIIFNQCFLSNCRISIEHINTSNGLYLL